MSWHDNLKIAIIEENSERASKIIKEMPAFDDLNEVQTAYSLIKEAIALASKEREKILNTMTKIQKTKEFLKN